MANLNAGTTTNSLNQFIHELWVSQIIFTLLKCSSLASVFSQRVDSRPYERSTEIEAVVFASIYLHKEIPFTMSHIYWIVWQADERHDQLGRSRLGSIFSTFSWDKAEP